MSNGKRATNRSQPAEGSDEITVVQAGRRGGNTTRDRYGTAFYREIGKVGGLRMKALYAHLFKDFGRLGGRPRRPHLADRGEEYPHKEGGCGRP